MGEAGIMRLHALPPGAIVLLALCLGAPAVRASGVAVPGRRGLLSLLELGDEARGSADVVTLNANGDADKFEDTARLAKVREEAKLLEKERTHLQAHMQGENAEKVKAKKIEEAAQKKYVKDSSNAKKAAEKAAAQK